MALLVNDILNDVSFALIEKIVNTTLGTVVTPGSRVVVPPSMDAIYVGAQLVCGVAGVNQEIITVVALVGTDSFRATFANNHPLTDPLFASTFPSGRQDSQPLFTQVEMLGYAGDAENEYLVRVRPIYASDSSVNITAGKKFYNSPSNAIRIERISIEGSVLYNHSQRDLDLSGMDAQAGAGNPKHWFQDEINSAMVGFSATPTLASTPKIFMSIAGRGQSNPYTFTDNFLLPDPFTGYIKWGVLERALSKDGEQRDSQRAVYCRQRFDVGVKIGQRFMAATEAALQQASASSQLVSP